MQIAFGENYDPLSRFEVPSSYAGRHGLNLQGVFHLSMRFLVIVVLSLFGYSAYLVEQLAGVLLCLAPVIYFLYLLVIEPMNITIKEDQFVMRSGFGFWVRSARYEDLISISLISRKARQDSYGTKRRVQRRGIKFQFDINQPEIICKIYTSNEWLIFPLDNYKNPGLLMKAIADRAKLNFTGGTKLNASYDKEAIHAA